MYLRTRGGILPLLALAIAVLASIGGCEDDTKPLITKFYATPECDVMILHTQATVDPVSGEVTSVDTLGTWLEVRFFARASSGNNVSDPTGANTPLEWVWNFGDGTTEKNLVNPSHRYTAAGLYTVTLTVKDDDGDEDSKSIQVLVGEEYGLLDILSVDVIAEPMIRYAAVPGSVSLTLLQAWGDQNRPTGWNMDFRGELLTDCSVSGLFEQYDWAWRIINQNSITDTTRIRAANPARLRLGMRYGHYEGHLEATETVTGIARADSALSRNPVGLKVGFTVPSQAVPNFTDDLTLDAYFLDGVKTFSFELEYADSALSFNRIDFNPALSAGGFVTSATDLGGGRVAVSLTHTGTFSTASATTSIGTLVMNTKSVVAGYYPIRIRRPLAIRPEGSDDTVEAPFSGLDGGVRLGLDCDGDQLADEFQLIYMWQQFDINRNGIIDACETP